MNEDIASHGFERVTAHEEDHLLLVVIQAFVVRGLHINGSDFKEVMKCMYSMHNVIDNNVITWTNAEHKISTKHTLIRVQEIDTWMSCYNQQIREVDLHVASCYLGCSFMVTNVRKKSSGVKFDEILFEYELVSSNTAHQKT